MKIILLRDGGFNRSLNISRRRLVAVSLVSVFVATSVLALGYHHIKKDAVDAEVVAQWREKLQRQDKIVSALERRSQAQSAAVGRQLADMKARLMRMEAIGEHMTEAANLENGEFDFTKPPAQGGPLAGAQANLGWHELQNEISGMAAHLRRRELELQILGSVLTSEDIVETSVISGRPVKWGWLASKYGQRVDPFTGQNAWHAGVDFAGREGSEIIAVASGVVTYAGQRSGYGQFVEIAHANGIVTRYAHHRETLVATGDVVKKGDTIARMGTTGRSTGPHVHFEVLKNGRTVDPTLYVRS